MELSDYQRGYLAYWSGLTDDISESEDWHRGYESARREDMRPGWRVNDQA